MNMMRVDRGFRRETACFVDVDISSEIAGKIDCIECEGTGIFLVVFEYGSESCVECKGTGKTWVSI